MTEQVLKLQQEMARTSLGVEIEMNGITRHRAAQVAAEFFGTGRWEDTNYRNGYRAFSAWDQQGREWMFKYDSSIEGPDSQKVELVTPILYLADVETLQELCRRLRKAGGRSDYTRHCGVHVHCGIDGQTPQSLRTLANLMASHEDLLAAALKLDPYRVERYCRPMDQRFLKEVNKKKPKTMEQLADIWYSSQGYDFHRESKYNRSRYKQLNYHAVFTHNTIEYRLFQFDPPADGKQNGIHAGALKAFIQLSLALTVKAKEIKTASSKPCQMDNPKFTMRTWLNSLGLIGREYETARRVFTRNLEGDAAFRFGREAYEATRRAA